MTKRLKVCLVSPIFSPWFSGAALRFERYIPGLVERGIDITVFAGEFSNVLATGKYPSIEQCTIKRVSMDTYRDKKSQRKYVRSLINYCLDSDTQPDVLHFLSVKSAWFAYYPALFRLQLPIIYSHTLLSAPPKTGIRRITFPYIQRLAVAPANHIIVNSQQAKRQYIELGINKSITYIPNGVDLKKFCPITSFKEKTKLREKLDLPAKVPIVISIGSIIPRKGVDLLVESWQFVSKKYPEALLLLVGEHGDKHNQDIPEFSAYINKLIEQSTDPSKIIVTGLVPNVVDYLRSSDIFAFTSYSEGMPNAVLEAYACGLPCVMTAFSGLEDSFGVPLQHYHMVDRNPIKMAEVLTNLIDDKNGATQMGQQAREFAEKGMSVDSALDHYAQTYTRVKN